MSTETEVIQIIREQSCMDDVQLAHSLEDDLQLDSLDRVELTMALEEAFDLEIPDEKADKVTTVRDAVELVADMVEGPA